MYSLRFVFDDFALTLVKVPSSRFIELFYCYSCCNHVKCDT